MSTTLTDASFNSLTAKLRELFELDKSDLDFGIYRILAAKQAQVNAFLDGHLRKKVDAVLKAHGGGQAQAIAAELAEATKQAQALGVEPDQSPKVKALKAQLAEVSGTEGGGLEADIYNHLLAFFSRYYEAGDFISKRRWKGDTYAIPYDGSEVVLHWANKDQYYIKSGEALKDYRFTLPGGKSVRFKLVDAAQGAKDNNKVKEGGERRYILDRETPWQADKSELELRFVYRPAAQEDWTPEDLAGATESAKKKPPAQDALIAQAERIALAGLAEAWKKPLAAPAVTKDGKTKDKTELRAKLEHFVARNTFDYFIHKNLGAFLKRELDFYIKNEVVRMDELENLGEAHLKQVQGKVKAVRQVAGDIIDFLHQVEEFQRKLWLKKKMVVRTDWIVTTDRLAPDLLKEVEKEGKQWEQWEALGFKEDGLQGTNWRKAAYLTGRKLPVDTSLFAPAFAERVIASVENVDEAITGTLVHSENFQGLNLLKERYRGEVKCVYIDPPYNTGGDGFCYRDAYQHSSWMSMMGDRVGLGREMMGEDGAMMASIDENEQTHLRQLLGTVFGQENFVGNITLLCNPKGRSQDKYFATNHEYVVVCSKTELPKGAFSIAKDEEQIAGDYPEEDDGGKYRVLELRNTHREFGKHNRRNLFYPFFVTSEGSVSLVAVDGTEKILPIWDDGFEGCWTWGSPKAETDIDLLVARKVGGRWKMYRKSYASGSDRMLKTILHDKSFYTERGQKEVAKLFGTRDRLFQSPKSPDFVAQLVQAASTPTSLTLDFFAGSGTTAHAVIALNREDQGKRKFILIEMGDYFHTVLKPRVTKVLYSPAWKDGKAQEHNASVSALVKVLRLESYEDALNNLPAPRTHAAVTALPAETQADYLMRYALDLELGPSLLNLSAFADPCAYRLTVQPAGGEELAPVAVDLVETFNCLLGLRVTRMGAWEHFAPKFETTIEGRVTAKLGAGKTAAASHAFRRIEGVDRAGARIGILWRKLSGDPAEDAAALEAYADQVKLNPKDYQAVYLNGPVTLAQPTQETRVIRSLEEEFRRRMFGAA